MTLILSIKQLKTTKAKYKEQEMIITVLSNKAHASIAYITLLPTRRTYSSWAGSLDKNIKRPLIDAIRNAINNTKLFKEDEVKEREDFLLNQVEPNLISILPTTNKEPTQDSYNDHFDFKINHYKK